MPALEAELRSDGDRHIDLIWLGRGRIPGIEPGSVLAVEGRLAVRRGRTTMFNPRYELGPAELAVRDLRAAS